MIDEVNERWRAESGSASAQSDYGVTRDRTADGAAESARQPIGKPPATSTENCELNTEPRFGETAPRQHSACVHAVDMLSGAAKWGALYGCEAFVLPSHQENFGIAVVEALACGKPVLISDQVNIWREIVEDGAGLVEGDTEEGVEKLLRNFLSGWRGGPSKVVSPSRAERAEASGRSAFAPSDSLLHSATAAQDGVTRGGPRECYLKRFAIGPAAAKLAAALKGAGVASDW
jgi:hypothetical protein